MPDLPAGPGLPGPERERTARIGREVFLLSLGGADLLGWALDRIANSLTDVFVARDAVVYREGERADEHFFVVSGEIVLCRSGAEPRRMGERSIVGVADMMLERPRTRTAIASVPTHLLRLRGEDWWGLLEDRIEVAHRIIFSLSDEIYRLELKEQPPAPVAPAIGHPAAEGPLSMIARILLLREAAILAHARVQALTTLAEAASEMDVAPEAVLFARGAMRGRLAVVASGQLIASPGDAAGVTFGPGAVVAGPAALSHSAEYEVRASASAGARALVLSLEEYLDMMEEHFSLVRSALRALTEHRERLTGP